MKSGSILMRSVFPAKGMLMSLYYKQQLTDVLKDIRYEDIRWKTDFSVDLVTSLCQSKQFNVADDVFCQCCLNRYVKPSWKRLDFCEPAIILDYFGKYHYHALAYYFCYVKKGFHFAWFVTLFDRFFVREKFIENMFRFSVSLKRTTRFRRISARIYTTTLSQNRSVK